MRSSDSTVERPAKRIRMHKVAACKRLRPRGMQSVLERVGVLYPLCQRLTQTATTQPSRHMIWYGEQVCGRAYGLCVEAVVLRVPRRGE
jgi:hypothetical protein